MPLGDYPFTTFPFGYDPVVPPSAPRKVRPPVALKLDGRTRDFPLDANGFYEEIHPVDQRVALALLISEGVIAAVPELGNRLRTITRVTPAVARTTAESYVRLCLSDLLAEKSIAIDAIVVETPSLGTLLVAVTYRNLQLQTSAARVVRAPLAFS